MSVFIKYKMQRCIFTTYFQLTPVPHLVEEIEIEDEEKEENGLRKFSILHPNQCTVRDERKLINSLFSTRNNVNVEGATHKQVVDLIKSGGDCLTLTVISVTQQEAERLEPQEDPGGYSYIDYSEKRSLPISIPDYNVVTRNGERFVVFNIHMAGRQLCSRRYREFSNLHTSLKKEFTGFNFPKLPSKWPFQLSEQQLDARRRGLEQYLEKVCAVRVIAESEAVQEFLTDNEDDLSASPVDIKVMLPDHEVVTVSVRKSANAQTVWDILVQRAHFTSYIQQYFYLFEIVEYNFGKNPTLILVYEVISQILEVN